MSNWNKVVAALPVDRVARRVAGPGEHPPDPPERRADLSSDLPIPVVPRHFWKDSIGPCNDMTGKKIGSLTVVGLKQWPVGKKGANWICRCDCGRYTWRRGRALRSPLNTEDSCAECRHVRHLREHR